MRTANTWGTVRKKKRQLKTGTTIFYRAAYQNPKATPGHEVSKSFRSERAASAWLEKEHRLVDAYWRGESDWSTPAEREAALKREAQRREITFAEYSQSFVDGYRKADGSILEESSARKKREALGHLLDAGFADKPLIAVTAQDIAVWLHDEQDIGQHALKRSWQLLKAVMKLACDEELIERSPVVTKAPRLPPSRQALIPTVTPSQWTLLLDAMPEDTRIALYLAAGCGLRIGEVCALQVGDVDVEHKTVTVRHSIGRGAGDRGLLRLKAPKTRTSYRTVDIADGFLPAFVDHLKTRPSDSDAMVIVAREGGIMNPNTLRAQFDRARRTAGRPDLHFHTLRATYVNGIQHNGATLKETMELAGHTAATVDALYQRADEDRKRVVADRYGRYLTSSVRTEERILKDIADTTAHLEELRRELARSTDHTE